MMGGMKKKLEAVVAAIEVAREELLEYEAPWLNPKFEDLRISVDRRLREAQLAVVAIGSAQEKN